MVSLSSFDVLGIKPSLYYKGVSRYKTALGGLLSVTVFALSAILLIYFLFKIFSRSNAAVIESNEFKDDSFLDYTQFPQIIQNGELYTIEQEDKMIRPEMVFFYTHEDGNAKQSYEIHQLKRCEKADFGDKYELFAEINNLDRYFCFPPELKLKFYGIYGGIKKYSATYLSISKCYFNPENDCYSKEKTEKIMDYFYVNFAFIDFNIQSNNIYNPSKAYLRQDRIQAGLNLYKRLFYELSVVQYETDYGYLFSDIRTENFFTASNFTLIPDTATPRAFFGITFSLSKKKVIITRYYEKFQQLISNFGGAVKALMLFAGVITSFFQDNYYFESLMQKEDKHKTGVSTVSVNSMVSSVKAVVQPKGWTEKMDWKTNILFYFRWNDKKASTFRKQLNRLKHELSLENVLEKLNCRLNKQVLNEKPSMNL